MANEVVKVEQNKLRLEQIKGENTHFVSRWYDSSGEGDGRGVGSGEGGGG